MNILYLTYDGLTDPLGNSQVLPYLIGLNNKQHNISIISFEKKNNFQKFKKNILQIIKNTNIKWYPLSYTKKPPVVSTIYDIIRLKSKCEKLIKNNSFQIIHCRSYITSLIGLQLKRKYHLKFIFDMRGFWADERVEGKIWDTNKFIFKAIYKYFKNKENEFFSEADHIISLTENGKNTIHKFKKVKNQPVPITVIPCCVDLNLFSYNNNIKSSNALKEKINISKNDFILSYLGSIGTWYMLDEMFEFFKRLKLKYNNAKFLFITTDDRTTILESAKKLKIDIEDIMIYKASRFEVPSYVLLSNLSIFFIKPTFSKIASSPTKQGEVMSLGIPVICNAKIGDTDKIINETKTGIIINEFNNEEYDSAVIKIDEVLGIPKETIIDVSRKYYSLDNGIDIYNKVYESLKNE